MEKGDFEPLSCFDSLADGTFEKTVCTIYNMKLYDMRNVMNLTIKKSKTQRQNAKKVKILYSLIGENMLYCFQRKRAAASVGAVLMLYEKETRLAKALEA